ncbi:MAG: DUF1275 domain-containing protein [Erysipelotrichaceae bacterium]|nr:DUF1275 domain-containing protein [Erysipelotrichaceae bacterium]
MRPDQRGSRTIIAAILLSLTGGFLDSYTYYVRDGVFANAQTANIIKLGLSIMSKDFSQCLYYLLPIIAFGIGVIFSLITEEICDHTRYNYPRRAILITEIILMFIISTLPQQRETNIAANVLVSLLCAMQMQTFQIFNKKSIATTVATGNLRSATEHLYKAIRNQDLSLIKSSLEYFGILLVFVSGVIIGALCADLMGIKAILVAAFFLTMTLIHITVIYYRVMSQLA